MKPDAEVQQRMQAETERTLDVIFSRKEVPATAFWLSFAGEDGFHGAVIVHAEDFLTALTECNLRGINPHGECQGVLIPAEAAALISDQWKNRILSREDCGKFDTEMCSLAAERKVGG